jgi:hypothetical protein
MTILIGESYRLLYISNAAPHLRNITTSLGQKTLYTLDALDRITCAVRGVVAYLGT